MDIHACHTPGASLRFVIYEGKYTNNKYDKLSVFWLVFLI